MEALVIVLSLFGCSDDLSHCEPLTETPLTWSSQAECEAHLPEALLAASDADFPTVTGKCRAVPNGSLVAEAVSAPRGQ